MPIADKYLDAALELATAGARPAAPSFNIHYRFESKRVRPEPAPELVEAVSAFMQERRVPRHRRQKGKP
jgi:hypothetical protein